MKRVRELRARLEDRPYRIALGGTAPRQLAARLSLLSVVTSVQIAGEEVVIETDGSQDLFETLTRTLVCRLMSKLSRLMALASINSR